MNFTRNDIFKRHLKIKLLSFVYLFIIALGGEAASFYEANSEVKDIAEDPTEGNAQSKNKSYLKFKILNLKFVQL
ncbi:hypothetical protein SAMN05443634_1117 [Chishuiella changwenlii]|uniref:Uncharacterized protein n=1 Tax=Chishuiella changwenlii TaxID=1434701 RepID=A0A1M7BJA4_9FLAO|nr:hypothetical protein GCM10010984_20050 [Chishuiella changwenlii]SHL55115.1 hypothetical protein SAMN05443634_1117 [Chishuiella changwenlii]